MDSEKRLIVQKQPEKRLDKHPAVLGTAPADYNQVR
jgi:hypothetical protein